VNITDGSRERIGIYIDISNVERTLVNLNEEGIFLDYSRLVEVLGEGKEVAVLKGYDCYVNADRGTTELHDALSAAGFELVLSRMSTSFDQVKRDSKCVQKEVDTGITTDASWDLALGKVDEAFIISGDRDMFPAYRRAKLEGMKLTIVSAENGFSQKYKDELDDYVLLEDLEVFTVFGEDCELEENIVSHSVIEEVAVDAE